MSSKNKKEEILEDRVNENTESLDNIGHYIVKTAPGYQKIFDKVQKAKDDPEKSKQLAAAYVQRTIFDLGNVFNFVKKLDNFALNGQTGCDKNFKEFWFTLKYEISSDNPKYKIEKGHDKKEKSFKLNDEEQKILFSSEVDDDHFSRDMALKRENLDTLVGSSRQHLKDKGIDINLKYSFTEIRYTKDYEKFLKENDELEKRFSGNKNPIVSRIIVRQKKGMRFVSKIDAKETGLDEVPLNLYERLCEEKGNYYLDSGILNKKRKKDLIKRINDYLNNLLSKRDEYYKRKILEKFGNIEVTPLKKVNKDNLNEIVNHIYSFLKKDPESLNKELKKDKNVGKDSRREQLYNLVNNFNLSNIREKDKKKIVNYISECFFPIRKKENNKKKTNPAIEDLIYPYLNIMLGTGLKGSELNYDFLEDVKESKTDKIKSKYEKLNGDYEKRICDRFGFTVLCARESDMQKILEEISSHFIGKNVYDRYVTNKKFDFKSLERGISQKRNMIVEIKDYTLKSKHNNYMSKQGKIFYGGIKGRNGYPMYFLSPYVDYTQPTLIEFQIMTENMYKNSKEGDASHNKMRFLQSLAIDIRNYNNRNNPFEIQRRKDLKERYLYVQ